MAGRTWSTVMCTVALAFTAGCSGQDATGRPAGTTVTVTATAPASPSASAPSVTSAVSPVDVLMRLAGREYPPATMRDIGRAICAEVRTGERDPSSPWRQMIGYLGDRRVGAIVGYSVATYCPEDAAGVAGALRGRLPR